jgi:hypothetical protein
LDDVDKVKVQSSIDNKIYNLLTTVPDNVNLFEAVRYLKPCGHPDAIYGDVDCRDAESYRKFDAVRFSVVWQEDRDSIYYDLKQKLDL